jgi:hypothetical protein
MGVCKYIMNAFWLYFSSRIVSSSSNGLPLGCAVVRPHLTLSHLTLTDGMFTSKICKYIYINIYGVGSAPPPLGTVPSPAPLHEFGCVVHPPLVGLLVFDTRFFRKAYDFNCFGRFEGVDSPPLPVGARHDNNRQKFRISRIFRKAKDAMVLGGSKESWAVTLPIPGGWAGGRL